MMRAIILFFVLLFASDCAWAQLDKLFFSPEDRLKLDVARDRASRIGGADYSAPYIDGLVRRSDGKNTVWVNGRPYRANDGITGKAASLPADPGERVSITVSSSERSTQRSRTAPRRATGK